MEIFKEQYKLITGSREEMIAHCGKMPHEYMIKLLPEFKNASVGVLLVHIANAYIYWIGNFALNKSIKLYEGDHYSIEEISIMYEKVNLLIDEFITKYGNDMSLIIEGYIPGIKKNLKYPALQVFMHVITHEFHHKGQVMSMSSLLGFPPPDADVIRF